MLIQIHCNVVVLCLHRSIQSKVRTTKNTICLLDTFDIYAFKEKFSKENIGMCEYKIEDSRLLANWTKWTVHSISY